MKAIFATKNNGKVNQLKEISKLCNIEMEIESEKDVGFDERVEETGTTFEENSTIKASSLKKYCDKNNIELPDCTCHSSNPVGRENILSYINSYKKSLQ